MAITDKGLLKHFAEFISNEYLGLVDYEIDSTPSPNKQDAIKSMREKIVKLENLWTQLQEILDEKSS